MTHQTALITKNQAGDTIVEVMIAVVVVGMVIASSFSIATRALNTARFAQEQTEALKVAESQLEKLKYNAAQFKSDVPDTQAIFASPSSSFCLGDVVPATKKTFPKLDSTDASCLKRSDLYNQSITYDSSQNLYTVTVSWDTLLSIPGNVKISYRLYK